MRRRACVAILAVLIAILSSCTTKKEILDAYTKDIQVQREKYNRACQTWVGSDINALIRGWSYPQEINSMPNGNKLLTYKKSSSMAVTDPGTATYTTFGNIGFKNQSESVSAVITFYCNTTFESDSNGKIVYWRAEGNNCLSN